jgi:AcrR family transcriptional regulator
LTAELSEEASASAELFAPAANARNSSPVTNQKEITQEKILCAAMELFATRGFDKTSISRIADRAGVSRTSIFWHFSDKATLFGETCRYFLVPFRESLERSGAHEDPRTRVLEQITAYEDFVTEHRTTIHSFVSWLFASQPHAESLLNELLALHRAFVASLQNDIRLLVDHDAEAASLAATIASTLHGNMLLGLIGAPPDTPQPRATLVRDLLDRLLPDP